MKRTPGMNINYMDSIIADQNFSDMEKLQKIFDICKCELKNTYPQLYYAILAVLDKNKKPDPSNYFNNLEFPNNASRTEMIRFIKNNPGEKITHTLFDASEYIYLAADGNVYDENGYLFEDWFGYHDGIRMRTGEYWESGWKRFL